MDVEHIIYKENGEEFKSFLNSNWYDTATPYQFCISELKKIKNEIDSGKAFLIVSYDQKYKISTSKEFEKWIVNIFLGGFEKFVFEK
ncbi:hypothetical protein IQ05_00088 [Flavobacterium tiangeerense]|uniref:Uncharacterized protein n=1 Tax=Flavobacterium tiangeerense TaxID=459471 RepID=A0ABY3FMV7_9FLAO|nr:hypothetical protein [Flavobacterium tiangeerense]TWI03159.1 hypothetical protein IQ05_00088 [Flavobacterium tiangeerense]